LKRFVEAYSDTRKEIGARDPNIAPISLISWWTPLSSANLLEKNMTTNFMFRSSRIVVSFILGITFSLFTGPAVFANPNGGIESKISLNVAWESLQYRENEPDTSLEARSDLHNTVLGIEGVKRWDHLFCGARYTFPISTESVQEDVKLSGKTSQENTLEMGWTRIDAFVGYPLIYWANPYMGFRWAKVKQERNSVLITGTAATLQALEELKSFSLLFGMGGVGKFTPYWAWNYQVELFLPLSVKVTNSALPGFQSSDKSGYMVELKGGIDYSFTDSIYSGLLLYGGWMHWNGSEWKSFDRGRAKWPENDSYYSGVGLNIFYKF
jgi:hypothetical protein